jgi:hypothetical protein
MGLLKSPFYLLFGLATTGFFIYQDYQGGLGSGVTRLTNVPKSLRDNPGAYRSHYSYLPRYVGGK